MQGGSDKGLDFAARHSDWIFTTMPTIKDYRDKVSSIHALATTYGRTVRAATMVWVLPDATDALANEKYNWIESQIDQVAVVNFLASMRGTSAEQIFALSNQLAEDPYAGIGKDAYIAVALGITAPRLVGSCETVAQKIEALHANGVESVLMCFFDPQQGLHQMQDHIIPIMKKMGLRKKTQ
jgi:alkanesulfonate monooxygenase SsuD/methylene tetrahydromethanopterin reductase-like flavin-dependent oxidoreductase (luciferase family)